MQVPPDVIAEMHKGRCSRVKAMMGSWRRRRVSAEPLRPDSTERDQMNTASALARFEAALTNQLTLAGADPTIEAAGQSLLVALGPATRQLATELAEQAATEVAAQLPGHDLDVVLREGEPTLVVRAPEAEPAGVEEDYEARITLRLPPSLKSLVEDAASSAGDSVNAWVVQALSGVARKPRGTGRRVRGTVQT